MDDPWANAWGGQSSSPKPPETWPVTTLPTSLHDQEADISQLPSWTSAAETSDTGITWTDTSDHASLWSTPQSNAQAWDASPYDNIPLGKTPTSSTEQSDTEQPEVESEPPPEVADVHIEELPITPQQDLDDTSTYATASPELYEPPTSDVIDDGDGFGSFESAADDEPQSNDPWTPAAHTFSSAPMSEEWGSSTWNNGVGEDPEVNDGEVQSGTTVDEWEEAKRLKELRDRQVPPELLASMMQQLSQLGRDLWPVDASDTSKQYDKLHGMDDLSEVLASATTRLLPALTLPPLTSFASTSTHKQLATALKLTRHLPLSQQSPMAFFLASKGNRDWEATARARPEKVGSQSSTENADNKIQGEFATGGLGWRILGADEREDLEEAWAKEHSSKSPKNKKSGGSWFWNRRSSTNVIASTPAQPSSPKAATPSSGNGDSEKSVAVEASAAGGTPRSSVDSSRSGKTASSLKTTTSNVTSTSLTGTSAVTTPGASIPSTPTVSSPAVPIPPALNDLSKSAENPSSGPSTLSSTPALTTSAPSAVSRFFSRFSRSKSTQSQEPRSLSLTSNDLEFLDDIPVASSDGGLVEADIYGADSLLEASMLGEEPVRKVLHKQPPEVRLPPPLAPPPKAPPPRAPPFAKPSLEEVRSPPPEDMSFFDQPFMEAEPAPVISPQQTETVKHSMDLDFGVFDTAASSTFDSGAFNTPLSPRVPPKDSPYRRMSQQIPTSTRNSLPSNGVAKKAQLQRRAPVVAVMSKSSGSEGPNNLFSLPPPPGSQRSSSPFAIPPSPASRPETPPVTLPISQTQAPPGMSLLSESQTNPGIGDDDEFSEFHSSAPVLSDAFSPVSISNSIPASSSAITNSSFNTSFSSAHSNHNLFSDTQTSASKDVEDDFDDFVSSPSPLRTPSPPKPPAKPSPLISQLSRSGSPLMSPHASSAFASPIPPLSVISSQHQQVEPATQNRRSSRGADHKRTTSLLEAAAAKPGVWPAPRSPAPSPLAPPPGGRANIETLKLDLNSPVSPSLSSPAMLGSSFTRVSADNRSATPVTDTLSSQPFITSTRPLGAMSPHWDTSAQARKMGQSSAPDMSFESLLASASPASLSENPSPAIIASNPTSSLFSSQPSKQPPSLSAQDLSFFEAL